MKTVRQWIVAGALALGGIAQPASAQKDDLALPDDMTRELQTRAAPQAASPPRSIGDVTALLEQHKPDPSRVQALKVAATREPPPGADKQTLATFYHERAQAAEQLGMLTRQVADLRRAEELADPAGLEWRTIARALARADEVNGNFANVLEIRKLMMARSSTDGQRLTEHTVFVRMHVAAGDLPAARTELRSAQAILIQARSNPRAFGSTRHNLMSTFEWARADVLQAEGKLSAAEGALRNSLAARDVALRVAPQVVGTVVASTLESSRRTQDWIELQLVQNLVLQGRLLEAEVTVRNILTRTFSRVGRYSPVGAQVVATFAAVLGEQGRPADAEAMARAAVDIHRQIGSAPESRELAQARRMLGSALVAQSRWTDAATVYEEMRAGLAGDPSLLRALAQGDVDWALALIRANRASEAIAMLEPAVKENTERLGPDNYRPAEQRGFLGLALAEAGQRERALVEFREAARVLLAPGRVIGEEREASPARSRRLVAILEGYIRLLHEVGGENEAAEAFLIADALRGQAVQGAMAASAARSAAGTPELAQLVRREQDAKFQLATLYAALLRMLNAPADQQLPQATAQMRTRIAELEKEQAGLSAEVGRRFPAYAELVSPCPATLEQARAALTEGEVLISVLVSGERTYVWAVPKQGAVTRHAASMGEAEVTRIVASLRRSLDPAESSIARLPEFDLAQASRLYDQILKPVEAAWKGAHTLLVVANGALAQLPFGLLPTGRTAGGEGAVRFAQYAKAPWLIRSIAVAQLPAVNTLVTLRGLKQPAGQRSAFAGFGDPQFGPQQVAAVADTGTPRMRSVRLATESRSAGAENRSYGLLPSLPDTREEILSIATALKADTGKDVFLGVQASKVNVQKANLATRRIVAFATHGLIPGDFPNLDEPALALAAPDGRADTGLLTLSEVLGLKLDADWVVLSACNTAAGDGAGAEAISGLGRGFFYAGSRALLVTHWPVETRSARQLVTTLFERYAADPKLSRAEALRQASLAVMEDAAKDASGKPLFSYAHPLFWAPYAVVGDGGR